MLLSFSRTGLGARPRYTPVSILPSVIMDVESKTPAGVVVTTDSHSSDDTPVQNDDGVSTMSSKVPWSMKVVAVMLVTAIGFGSHWASGVTGAMKSTLKKASRPWKSGDNIILTIRNIGT